MNNKELCESIGITEPTIYNWKKNKPKLYSILMEYKNKTKNNLVDEDFINDFNQLTEEEKSMYKYEIKAKVMRKKLK